MSNIQPGRLLDTRFYDPDENEDAEGADESGERESELLQIARA